jgi:hypothetical protein
VNWFKNAFITIDLSDDMVAVVLGRMWGVWLYVLMS